MPSPQSCFAVTVLRRGRACQHSTRVVTQLAGSVRGKGRAVSFFLSLLLNGLLTGAVYALIALAFVVVYKSSRMINFAVGEWVMFGSLLVATGLHVLAVGLVPAI